MARSIKKKELGKVIYLKDILELRKVKKAQLTRSERWKEFRLALSEYMRVICEGNRK